MASVVKFDKWLNSDGTARNMVLQTVEYYLKDPMVISCPSGGTWYDATGFSATITPKFADSKILILCHMHSGSGYWEVGFRFLRNGTATGVSSRPSPFAGLAGGFANNKGMHHDNGRNNVWNNGYTYLDSPGSTAPQTYQLQVNGYNGYSVYLNRSYYYTDSSDHENTKISSLILMEIQQ